MSTKELRSLFPAVRALDRIWAPIAARYQEGREADHAIDCGEFSSGPSWDDELSDFDDAIARVAHRFGISAESLQSAVEYRTNFQWRTRS